LDEVDVCDFFGYCVFDLDVWVYFDEDVVVVGGE